jgi:hypothetical protein
MISRWTLAAAPLLALIVPASIDARSAAHRAAPAQQAITPEQLMRHIKVLASDDFEGRKPGTTGENKTLLYIATQMAAMGLEPAAGSSCTLHSSTTRKPTGVMQMPELAPPAKGKDESVFPCWDEPFELSPYSPPPATKAKLTFVIGMIVEPSAETTGSPTMVLTSTISLILAIAVCIMFSIGCMFLTSCSKFVDKISKYNICRRNGDYAVGM